MRVGLSGSLTLRSGVGVPQPSFTLSGSFDSATPSTGVLKEHEKRAETQDSSADAFSSDREGP